MPGSTKGMKERCGTAFHLFIQNLNVEINSCVFIKKLSGFIREIIKVAVGYHVEVKRAYVPLQTTQFSYISFRALSVGVFSS